MKKQLHREQKLASRTILPRSDLRAVLAGTTAEEADRVGDAGINGTHLMTRTMAWSRRLYSSIAHQR